ncbi:hypothetical protein MKW94_005566, partial [Papaver nudicaule]|nr:hypothetical protein [Papaver nudicaule]
MNQIRRFSVSRSSSLLRKNLFTRWSSSQPMSSCFSSLISNNNNPSSSNLLRRVFISNPYPPPQIPGNHVRNFTGEAAEECNFDENYLNDEIWVIRNAASFAQCNIESCTGPPLDAVKILADKLDAFREKLGYDTEKNYPDHLEKFSEALDDLEYYGEMVLAFGEFMEDVDEGRKRESQNKKSEDSCIAAADEDKKQYDEGI